LYRAVLPAAVLWLTPLSQVTAYDINDNGPDDAGNINAGMLVEILILSSKKCVLDIGREVSLYQHSCGSPQRALI
jgi:hypothetical protein